VDSNFSVPMKIEYELNVNEPFLRVSVTGSAPSATVIMVNLPTVNVSDTVIYGTPYHWEFRYPLYPFGEGQTFYPTHNFIIAANHQTQNYSLAVYQGGEIGAWTLTDNTLSGILFRNSPGSACQDYGAEGTDFAEHRIHYAIRVPSSLSSPATGQPLLESLAFQTPLISLVLNSSSNSSNPFPSQFSLAQASPGAIITAAKAKTVNPESQMIFRVYQPTNAPLNVQLNVTATLAANASASIVTALESAFVSSYFETSYHFLPQQPLTPQPGLSVNFSADYAITTVLIG